MHMHTHVECMRCARESVIRTFTRNTKRTDKHVYHACPPIPRAHSHGKSPPDAKERMLGGHPRDVVGGGARDVAVGGRSQDSDEGSNGMTVPLGSVETPTKGTPASTDGSPDPAGIYTHMKNSLMPASRELPQIDGDAPAVFPYSASVFDYAGRRRTYDEEKQRVPSWCDRVLWRSLPGPYPLSAAAPSDIDDPHFYGSDHAPIGAIFELELPVPCYLSTLPSSPPPKLPPVSPLPLATLGRSCQKTSASTTAPSI